MRIRSIQLTNYKRFTNLLIDNIPENARLVVLTGPNGSGKSSLFDAFLCKSSDRKNYHLDREKIGYYIKDKTFSNIPNTTLEVSRTIDIKTHSTGPNEEKWNTAFRIRSPYRNESDFQTTTLEKILPISETPRFARIIDSDQSVSENYRRLAWKRMADLDSDAAENLTFREYREKSLGDLQLAMKNLFTQPNLELRDFGGLRDSGVFRFKKGNVDNFHYKNLSGGEKAAFDILLDIFVSRDEFQNAIYCIDEPEGHIATALHGRILDEILGLLPENAQLWIATHSVGFLRKAYDIMKMSNNVAFLDFSGHDFDQAVEIEPIVPDHRFWKNIYKVTLDDLSELILPANIVICEGNKNQIQHSFDAKCYNELFSNTHPETLFISGGGSKEIQTNDNLTKILPAMASGVSFWKLIDRDDMTDSKRQENIKNGVRVLRKREIEDYLYDPAVLKTFLKKNNEEGTIDAILQCQKDLLSEESTSSNDMKKISRMLFEFIRKKTCIPNLGNTREEFAIEYLVPALKETPKIFKEIEDDVFPSHA